MADYSEHYSDEGFWSKLGRLPESAGCRLARSAVTLWCVLKSPDTPLWARTTIVAALAYFVWPIDLLPDPLPGGLLDDAAVLGLALAEIELFVTPEIQEEVERRLPARCRERLRLPPP